LQNVILKFILLISSVLSINAALAIPLSSVISTDTQQVEYTQKRSEISLPNLQKICKKPLTNVFISDNTNETYLYTATFTHFFESSFNLYKESLLVVNELTIKQRFQVQKKIIQKVSVNIHLRLNKTLFQTESPYHNV